jgi:hypothetical protein
MLKTALAALLAAALPGAGVAVAVTQVPVDSTGFFGGFLGVDAVSSTDGWAVGGNGNGMIQRFNGTRWTSFPSPDLLGATNGWADLTGVDALSSTSAFAVGNSTAVSGGAKSAVAERWNGASWTRLPVPKPAATDTEFNAVKAFSANDAWAVGQSASTNSTVRMTLAMHFNGTAWTAVPTPSPGTRTNFLTAVDGVGSNDVWAVGYSLNLPYGNRVRQSVTLHWNGAAWTQVASPNSDSTFLYDVATLSPTDAWAVGSASTGGAFVIRWNGTAWNSVAAPPLLSLSGVTARSSSDVWVTGFDSSSRPAVAHWNGSSWSVSLVTVTGGPGSPLLEAIAAPDAGTEWAVGAQSDGATGQSASIAFRVTGS